jgi:hypothetical protein
VVFQLAAGHLFIRIVASRPSVNGTIMETRTVRERDFAALAAYEAAVAVTARATGVSEDRLKRRKTRRAGEHAARRQAIYLAVITFNREMRSVSRVSGLSPKTVHLFCRAVEDERDDPKFDAALARLELELTQ